MMFNLRSRYVVLITLVLQFLVSLRLTAEEESADRDKLISFVVNSSIPKVGLTKGFSASTLLTLFDFLQKDSDALPLLGLSDTEAAVMNTWLSEISLVDEDELDRKLSTLDEKIRSRLEAIATSIDGLGRIAERLKYNKVQLSKLSFEQMALLKKKFEIERAGPLISSAFALASTENDRIAVAVAEVKCQIDFGIQFIAILTPAEKSSVLRFVSLSESEIRFRNEFIKKRYSLMDGFKRIAPESSPSEPEK